jgi:hypothetical protein
VAAGDRSLFRFCMVVRLVVFFFFFFLCGWFLALLFAGSHLVIYLFAKLPFYCSDCLF